MDQEFSKWKEVCLNIDADQKWLRTAVIVSDNFEGKVINPNVLRAEVKALWDTGSTTTIISPEIVKILGLKPINKEPVVHLLGEGEVNVYKIALIISNDVSLQNVIAIEMPCTTNTFHMIIGMNVIKLGDFSLKRRGDQIKLNFTLPVHKKLTIGEK